MSLSVLTKLTNATADIDIYCNSLSVLQAPNQQTFNLTALVFTGASQSLNLNPITVEVKYFTIGQVAVLTFPDFGVPLSEQRAGGGRLSFDTAGTVIDTSGLLGSALGLYDTASSTTLEFGAASRSTARIVFIDTDSLTGNFDPLQDVVFRSFTMFMRA